MNAQLNFEKTTMIQPDPNLFDNYLSSKQEVARIKQTKEIKNERVQILQETNERLNAEVQNLKKEVQRLNQANANANQQTDKQLLSKLKVLETQYKSEKKKSLLAALKVEKLEQLLEDVYEAEESNLAEKIDRNSLQSVNSQLTSLLQKLKD